MNRSAGTLTSDWESLFLQGVPSGPERMKARTVFRLPVLRKRILRCARPGFEVFVSCQGRFVAFAERAVTCSIALPRCKPGFYEHYAPASLAGIGHGDDAFSGRTVLGKRPTDGAFCTVRAVQTVFRFFRVVTKVHRATGPANRLLSFQSPVAAVTRAEKLSTS